MLSLESPAKTSQQADSAGRQPSAWTMIRALAALDTAEVAEVGGESLMKVLMACAVHTNPARDRGSYRWTAPPAMLANETRLSIRTVQRILRECRRLGWVEVVDKGVQPGRGYADGSAREIRPMVWQAFLERWPRASVEDVSNDDSCRSYPELATTTAVVAKGNAGDSQAKNGIATSTAVVPNSKSAIATSTAVVPNGIETTDFGDSNDSPLLRARALKLNTLNTLEVSSVTTGETVEQKSEETCLGCQRAFKTTAGLNAHQRDCSDWFMTILAESLPKASARPVTDDDDDDDHLPF